MSEIDPSTIDLYALLSISPSSTESEIRRAYRKTSRLYHPDKVEPTAENLQKFHQLQTALHILTDPAERSKYDASREAKVRREAENAALEGRRRKMKEDLERAENGAVNASGTGGGKRSWSERELEIKRIAEENRRRREDVLARKARDAQEVEDQKAAKNESNPMERSVKVRWVKEGDGLDVDGEALVEIFPAGEVENVAMLKDKKRKLEGRDRKVVMGTALLVFRSLAAAKKAVARGKTEELESVEWAAAAEKEKDSI